MGISAGIVNQSSIRVQTLQIPTYSIGLLRGNNVSGTVVGIPDSNGVYARTTGIVLGGNRRGATSTAPAGLEFFIFDPVSNAGIGVFRTANFTTNPYTVTEGDLIRVIGTVSHFNGLAQINVDSIVVLSSGNALPAPQVVTSMSDLTESRLIRINNLTLVPSTSTSAQWPVSGATGSGRTPRATNGVDTFDIRIDNDVNLFNSPAPSGTFSMIGVGSQFDNSNPHTSGYQLCPRYLQDLVQVVTYSVSGTLTYNNTASTPMTNSVVRLLDGSGAVVASDSTDSSGTYLIPGVLNGNYTLSGATGKPWGGVTATDALGATRHFTGAVPLLGLRVGAADVNGSSTITSGDALLINRRFSGTISSFSAGNWLSEVPAVSVSGANLAQNLKMLAYGDVNGSYLPPLNSRSQTNLVLVEHDDARLDRLDDRTVRMQIRADRSMLMGALSLELVLPQGFGLKGVVPAWSEGNLSWGQRDGMWCIGWFGEQGVQLAENDLLLSLEVEADQEYLWESWHSGSILLGPQSEIADYWGEVQSTRVRIPRIVLLETASTESPSMTVYPNPATGPLHWSLDQGWHSKGTLLQLLDLTGRILIHLPVADEQHSGLLNLDNMASGQYLLRVIGTDGTILGQARIYRP
jgi:hypothetical protein